jgi:hypothetical protein
MPVVLVQIYPMDRAVLELMSAGRSTITSRGYWYSTNIAHYTFVTCPREDMRVQIGLMWHDDSRHVGMGGYMLDPHGDAWLKELQSLCLVFDDIAKERPPLWISSLRSMALRVILTAGEPAPELSPHARLVLCAQS